MVTVTSKSHIRTEKGISRVINAYIKLTIIIYPILLQLFKQQALFDAYITDSIQFSIPKNSTKRHRDITNIIYTVYINGTFERTL